MITKEPASRAVQFSAFDALKGYDELLAAGMLVPEERRELSEDAIAEISDALSRVKRGVTVKVTHYGERRYRESVGVVSSIDALFGFLFVGKERILFSDVLKIEFL